MHDPLRDYRQDCLLHGLLSVCNLQGRLSGESRPLWLVANLERSRLSRPGGQTDSLVQARVSKICFNFLKAAQLLLDAADTSPNGIIADK